MHSVSVIGVVVDDDGRVLLQRRCDNGAWEPPGGVLEMDERIADGLCREVREETGLEVRAVRLTGVYKSMPAAVVELVFACEVTGGRLTLSEESTAFHWASPADLALFTTEAFEVRIRDALPPGGTPFVREHDGFRLV
ncbi:NUDIX domain-containing protein [Herbidospora sp. NEAU-GS84]|uniref:NUDIX domain-containing protein n=1 Tax=Herbidospora solisilvae TaxID=2696284 RepID=A0A7C9K1W7_9ACTN|nr:NUDIX domain-containing protein [Herbidospora solisilvae]NAS27079.1 NUDIX domain-containing protein [Herbidospora solisilvae]